MKVFISYSSQNKKHAVQFSKGLTALGHEVWRDAERLEIGDNWQKEIQDGILWCDAFLLLWSVPASQSTFVNDEILFANSHKKPIYPVRVDDIDPRHSIITNSRQTLDGRTDKEIASAIQRIHTKLTNQPPIITPTPKPNNPNRLPIAVIIAVIGMTVIMVLLMSNKSDVLASPTLTQVTSSVPTHSLITPSIPPSDTVLPVTPTPTLLTEPSVEAITATVSSQLHDVPETIDLYMQLLVNGNDELTLYFEETTDLTLLQVDDYKLVKLFPNSPWIQGGNCLRLIREGSNPIKPLRCNDNTSQDTEYPLTPSDIFWFDDANNRFRTIEVRYDEVTSALCDTNQSSCEIRFTVPRSTPTPTLLNEPSVETITPTVSSQLQDVPETIDSTFLETWANAEGRKPNASLMTASNNHLQAIRAFGIANLRTDQTNGFPLTEPTALAFAIKTQYTTALKVITVISQSKDVTRTEWENALASAGSLEGYTDVGYILSVADAPGVTFVVILLGTPP